MPPLFVRVLPVQDVAGLLLRWGPAGKRLSNLTSQSQASGDDSAEEEGGRNETLLYRAAQLQEMMGLLSR